jgi:TonB family protein
VQIVGSTQGAALSFSEEPSVEAGLDRDQIMAVINRHRGQIVFCYEKGLEQDPSLKGRLSVQFTIAPNGRVQVAQVAHSSLESKLVENCVLSRLRSWQFPKPVGAVHVDVLYPFDLSRVAGR